jgi:hypothetical protein
VRWICPVRSLDLSLGARRLDDTAGRIEGGLYTHISRIQQDRVVSLYHRGRISAGIPLVESDVLSTCRQLLPAALGTNLTAGRNIELGHGIGRDHSSDIATIQNRPPLLCGKVLLKLEQGSAHTWIGGHAAGSLTGMAFSQTLIIRQTCRVQSLGGLFGCGLIAQFLTGIQHCQTHRTIKQSRVQMGQTVKACQTRGDCPLARGGGAINSDDKCLGQGSLFSVGNLDYKTGIGTAKPIASHGRW